MEKKQKEFIKYKLHQHQDVPLGIPYGKEMDPDFEQKKIEKREKREMGEAEDSPDLHRYGAMKPPVAKGQPIEDRLVPPGSSKSNMPAPMTSMGDPRKPSSAQGYSPNKMMTPGPNQAWADDDIDPYDGSPRVAGNPGRDPLQETNPYGAKTFSSPGPKGYPQDQDPQGYSPDNFHPGQDDYNNNQQPQEDEMDYMPADFNEVVVKTGPHGGAITDPKTHPLVQPPIVNQGYTDSSPNPTGDRGYL